MTISAKNTV